MTIDFSRVDAHQSTTSAINDDVAYLRQHSKQFITTVDQQEQLHTQSVIPLPLGTWNAAYVLQPANLVLKLSPWSNQFEADFLRCATDVYARVPRFHTTGTIPNRRLPQASYLLMEYIADSINPGLLFEQGHLTPAQLGAIGTPLSTTLARLHQVTFAYLRNFDVKGDLLLTQIADGF